MILATLALIASPADIVIDHAVIWTGGRLTKMSCVAVREGRIVHVGGFDVSFVGPKTQVLDAKGKVLMPAFIDSHVHFMSGGETLTRLDLRGANTKQEFLRRIKDYGATLSSKETLVGSSWSAESWPDKSQPNRYDVDSVTGDRPAVLYRMDGHSLLVNSAAIKKMGITKDTPSPAGGSIDKDPTTGEPTGLLRETAMVRVGFILPPTSAAQTMQGLRAAVKLANSYGIGSVSEIGSTGDFGNYREYASSNPTLRFSLYAVATNWTNEIQAIKSFKPVPEWLQANGIKAFMDGSLGSRTAWMLEPYTKPLPDQKSPTGLPRPGFSDGTYEKGIRAAAAADLQVIVHAIGDRANREILSLFEKAAPNLATLRFRVEHAQHLTAEDIKRFGRLGVIPSMQPYHKSDDGRYCEEVIGTERSKTSYAYRDLLNSNARLAFGSDWPVVGDNPWLGIEAAVTGKILTGKTWMTHQNISIDEALTAYTATGAYAMKRDDDLGQIKVGYLADLQILNMSPFKKGVDYTTIRPETLLVGGKKVL